MIEKEYDFSYYTSSPSSFKIATDEPIRILHRLRKQIPVKGGTTITADCMMKVENVGFDPPHIYIHYFDGTRWVYEYYIHSRGIVKPSDTMDWFKAPGYFRGEDPSKGLLLPPEATKLMFTLLVAGDRDATPETSTVWFDDLRIYEDGVLIYEDDFTSPSDWGVGATVKVNGVCDAGYPTPDMTLELYDNGVLRKTVTILGSDLALGTPYTLSDVMGTTDVGYHVAYGRMVLSNPLGDWEFTTPETEFSIGEAPPGEVTVDVTLA